MFLEGLIDRGAMPVLRQVMMFTEKRQEVLANNLTNFDTVGYTMKDLDVAAFNEELRSSVERRDKRGTGAMLEMRDRRNLTWNESGGLQVHPIEIKDNNILFHDENNRFVEKQMSEMAQNALRHNIAVELMRQKNALMEIAIRGRL